jgi:hypothetical protein
LDNRVPDEVKRVYSVTLNGKNDCVVMTEEEASLITLKFAGVSANFELYDMTAKHGMLPYMLHKLERMQYYPQSYENWRWDGPLPQAPYKKGVGPGQFGGAAKTVWEFEDLIGDEYV